MYFGGKVNYVPVQVLLRTPIRFAEVFPYKYTTEKYGKTRNNSER